MRSHSDVCIDLFDYKPIRGLLGLLATPKEDCLTYDLVCMSDGHGTDMVFYYRFFGRILSDWCGRGGVVLELVATWSYLVLPGLR